MLSNLDEVGEKMRSLMKKMNEFETEVSTPYEAKKSNIRNSILIKIPKYLMLIKLIPFLTNRQTFYLSNTCIFLRRAIYSPLGWKILSQIHTPFEKIIINPEILKKPFKKQVSYSSEAEDHVEDYQDEQFLLKQRAKYKEVLWTRYKQHLIVKEKNEVLEEKFRTQKMFLFKTKLQKTFFQKQRDDLQQQNIKFKEKLKKMTSDFLIKDQKLSKKIQYLEEENAKLQKQKQALVCKIRQYQDEMPKVEKKAQVSKKTLKLLKDFVESKDYEPLEDIQ